MTTEGSIAGRELFDGLNKAYEDAYQNNPSKTAIVSHAISLLQTPANFKSSIRVLDVGCGTGVPVSQMLANADFEVRGFDIAPTMVVLAGSRVQGNFTVGDMLTYKPQDDFAGVFMIFAHLQLTYADFHAACFKFAQALQPGGLLVIGQMPADNYVTDERAYDHSRSWVENYDAPFMGKPLPTFMMTAQGQRNFLTSMGLQIVKETLEVFQPENPICAPEDQQYIIARRPGSDSLKPPQPLPR